MNHQDTKGTKVIVVETQRRKDAKGIVVLDHRGHGGCREHRDHCCLLLPLKITHLGDKLTVSPCPTYHPQVDVYIDEAKLPPTSRSVEVLPTIGI